MWCILSGTDEIFLYNPSHEWSRFCYNRKGLPHTVTTEAPFLPVSYLFDLLTVLCLHNSATLKKNLPAWEIVKRDSCCLISKTSAHSLLVILPVIITTGVNLTLITSRFTPLLCFLYHALECVCTHPKRWWFFLAGSKDDITILLCLLSECQWNFTRAWPELTCPQHWFGVAIQRS